MTSIIVAATPVAGHSLPLLEIGGRLNAAGHNVSFLGGRRFLPRAAELGMKTVALTGRADYDDRRMASEFPDAAALPPGLERLNAETIHIFGDPIPDQHEALQQLLRAEPDQVLVTDILFAGAFPAACGLGQRPRRWVSVGIAPLYVRSVDTSPFGPVPVEAGTDAGAANLAAFDAFTAALQPAYDHVRVLMESMGVTLNSPDWVSALYDLPDVTAQLSVPQFEFARTDLPESIHFVGIAPPASIDWQTPDWWAELDRGKPVILVTQGTLANHDLTELIAPSLKALADQDYVVIAALGRPVADLATRIPPNAHVVEYVSFDRLLPHVDVMVTNGGFGATQQALAAGVPVVVAGASEDKPATAARVAYHRVGIDLGTQRPASDVIRAAVSELLGDTGMPERVDAMAQAYGGYDVDTLLEKLVTD